MTKNGNPASNTTWYPNSTNHLFSVTESGWFFRLLRHLPQALANKNCSGTQPSGLRLRDQRSLTIERKDRRPSGQRSVIFFKLGQFTIHGDFFVGRGFPDAPFTIYTVGEGFNPPYRYATMLLREGRRPSPTRNLPNMSSRGGQDGQRVHWPPTANPEGRSSE